MEHGDLENTKTSKNVFKFFAVLYFIVLELMWWSAEWIEYTSVPFLNTTPGYFRKFLLEMIIYLKDQWEIELLLVIYKLAIFSLILYLGNLLFEHGDDLPAKEQSIF